MTLNCPTCRRRFELEDSLGECSRCGTELKSLKKIVLAAELRLRKGREALRRQDYSRALEAFKDSFRLRHTKNARRGLATTLICLGKYDLAVPFLRESRPLSLVSKVETQRGSET